MSAEISWSLLSETQGMDLFNQQPTFDDEDLILDDEPIECEQQSTNGSQVPLTPSLSPNLLNSQYISAPNSPSLFCFSDLDSQEVQEGLSANEEPEINEQKDRIELLKLEKQKLELLLAQNQFDEDSLGGIGLLIDSQISESDLQDKYISEKLSQKPFTSKIEPKKQLTNTINLKKRKAEDELMPTQWLSKRVKRDKKVSTNLLTQHQIDSFFNVEKQPAVNTSTVNISVNTNVNMTSSSTVNTNLVVNDDNNSNKKQAMKQIQNTNTNLVVNDDDNSNKKQTKTSQGEDSGSDSDKSSHKIKTIRKFVILGTSLHTHMKQELQSTVSLLGKAKLAKQFDYTVTHVVTSLTDKHKNLTRRTINYALGVLSGKPVVSYQWVVDSTLHGTWQDPDLYLVMGDGMVDTKKENDIKKKFDLKWRNGFKLFEGYLFYFDDDETRDGPPKNELIQLIKCGGGKIICRLSRKSNDVNVVIVGNKDLQKKKYRDYNVVNGNWFLDCVSLYYLYSLGKSK